MIGFQVVCSDYVERRTINKKEQIDVPRNFVQGKFRKPISESIQYQIVHFILDLTDRRVLDLWKF